MTKETKPKRIGLGLRLFGYFVMNAIVLVLGLMPQNSAIHLSSSDKADHFAAFAVLMLVGQLAFPARFHVALGFGLICFGGLIELLQGIPSLNRSPDWMDWLVEVAAICLVGPLYVRLSAIMKAVWA